MNYASVVWMGFASISLIWYLIRGRHHFTGPPVVQDADPTLEGKAHPVDLDGELGLETDTSHTTAKEPFKEA